MLCTVPDGARPAANTTHPATAKIAPVLAADRLRLPCPVIVHSLSLGLLVC
jgi:hypothetical protein